MLCYGPARSKIWREPSNTALPHLGTDSSGRTAGVVTYTLVEYQSTMESLMTRQFPIAAVAMNLLLSVAGCAAVKPHDPMAAYYANTLHETRANGTQTWFQFNADHSFKSMNQDHKAMTGTWTINAQRETCITISGSGRPPPPCAKLQAQKIGDSWNQQGPAGNEHFVLERGRG